MTVILKKKKGNKEGMKIKNDASQLTIILSLISLGSPEFAKLIPNYVAITPMSVSRENR